MEVLRPFAGSKSGIKVIWMDSEGREGFLPPCSIIPGVTVNFYKRYWIFIAAALACAVISSGITLYLASVEENFMECNSVSAACFASLGMIPCMVMGILALLPVMVAIPYILRQNGSVGIPSMILLGAIVAYTAFDAVNNVSALFGYQQTYLIAHTVLTGANNVTGAIVGTGDSLC